MTQILHGDVGHLPHIEVLIRPYKSLDVTDIQITHFSHSPEVVVYHIPTGIMVNCKETNNPSLNRSAAISYLAEKVHYHKLLQRRPQPEQTMPKVEKAYDKVALTTYEVQQALKEYIQKTARRQVRGDVHVQSTGSGLNTSAWALLEDGPAVAVAEVSQNPNPPMA